MPKLTPEGLAELRRIANAATPGPWIKDADKRNSVRSHWNPPRDGNVVGWQVCVVSGNGPQSDADWDYITEFNPKTTLALLDRIEELERELGTYAPEGYIQRCTACCGRGRRDYPDTSTWRGGGYAGQVITTDICDRCWGTGDEARPGTDLRAMVQEYRERLETKRWKQQYEEGGGDE